MSNEQMTYLKAMDIDVWVERSELTESNISNTLSQKTSSAPIADNWEALEQQAQGCTACPLHQSRQNVVFGSGSDNADVLVIGEAPGEQEDKQGAPFVGPSGELLTKMLKAIDLGRDSDVYITNIIKCRPPNNRDPLTKEISQCTGYLHAQIKLLQPKIILALGKVAASHLLQMQEPMEKLRDKVHTYGPLNTPLIVTYHPAFLLRTPSEKRAAYQDLLLLKSKL